MDGGATVGRELCEGGAGGDTAVLVARRRRGWKGLRFGMGADWCFFFLPRFTLAAVLSIDLRDFVVVWCWNNIFFPGSDC